METFAMQTKKLTLSEFSPFVGFWHRDAVMEWTSHL